MEVCSRAGMMNLRCLFRLVMRAWPKMLPFSPSLLKTIQTDDEYVHPPLREMAAMSPALPQDILEDIFALLEIPDLVRASSVCSSWHAAYVSLRGSGRYRRPQTPCLLYTSESAGDSVACLYSLTEKKVYKLTLPEPPICHRNVIGSSLGLLVTADERSELHVVNPVTGEQLALPSVTTIEQVKPIFDDEGVLKQYEFSQYFGEEEITIPFVHDLENLRDELYIKAFVFSDSSTGSYIVVLIHNPIDQLSFARAGDSQWTWLPPSAGYEDCIYMDGILYAVTSNGGIDAFDLTGPTVVRKVVMEKMKNYIFEQLYIVQTPSGDLLQVWRDQDVAVRDDAQMDARELDDSEIVEETRAIMLYQIDMAAKELFKINSLHDHVLFLGLGQSHCLNIEEYPQLKGNHVYLTDDAHGFALWKRSCRDIGVFNLENTAWKKLCLLSLGAAGRLPYG